MLTQYQQHVAGERAQERANERTYMNVQPVAMLGRSRTRREGEGGLDEPRCNIVSMCLFVLLINFFLPYKVHSCHSL